ncbi:MAG: hypothetical protein Q8K55_16365 [Gemmatimonadaceae bacterium]|nr:hypothetical protein [Gemmatimonadaceae bacterium]
MSISLRIAGLLVASAVTVSAQSHTPQPRRWEFRLASGAFVPTGSGRDVNKQAQMSTFQLSWAPRSALAISGTFGWARSRDLGSANAPKLDIFMSDVGVEVRPAQWFAGHAVTFSPFAGLGAGVRSYNYRSLDVDATHNLAGYGTLGGEFVAGRAGLRLEARNYMSGYKPLVGFGKADMHNDIVFTVALRLTRHRAAQR